MTPAVPDEDARRQQAEIGLGTHLFLILCGALVVGFIVWAVVGRLGVVSTAVGEVIPSSQVKSVQHLEGGIVREIMVREGQTVEEGQPLVALEPTASGADVGELQVRITSLRAAVARLEAEAAGAESIDFPEDLAENHPEVVAEARSLFKSRRSSLRSRISSQKEQIHQRRQQIREIRSRLANRREKLKHVREQVKISEDLLRDDLTNRMLHLDLLKEAASLKGSIGEDVAALERTQSAIKEAEAQLDGIRSAYLSEVQEELEKKRRELAEFNRRMAKYEDSLDRTVLRSPVDGVVKTLYVVTEGGVVQPGGTVADVVPGADRLVIEARLPTQDVGYVHPGQTATVKLASRDAMRFGDLEGKVVNVSPDAIETEQGPPYYKVRIETDRDYFERNSLTYRLVPGVQVMCNIRTGERRVIEYLLDPFVSSFDTAFRER